MRDFLPTSTADAIGRWSTRSLALAFCAGIAVTILMQRWYDAPTRMTASAAREAVRQILIDPDSAQFDSEVATSDGTGTCGLVNAKNSMGGYVGRRPFLYKDGRALLLGVTPSTDQLDLLNLTPASSTSWADHYSELDQGCRTLEEIRKACPTAFSAMADGGHPKFCAAWKRTDGNVREMISLEQQGAFIE